ncbi:MAG: hypothetical protein WHT65_03005 [Pseudothermotoga sp.]
MKGVKLWLVGVALVVVLILVSCAPGNRTISSVAHNVVEVTANIKDTNLENLANWCDSKNILMLWYDYDNQPTGFTERSIVFETTAADKSVYLNNEFVENYATTGLTTIQATINSSITNLSGTLTLYLRADDLLGTQWDLVIGESGQTKAVAITNYVLVEFEEIDTTNHVYQVTKVQVGGDWNNFTVPKDIPLSNLANKGFAFFRIDDDKVVDARVIYPFHP